MKVQDDFILTIDDSEDDIQYDDNDVDAAEEGDKVPVKTPKKKSKKQKGKEESEFSNDFMFETDVNQGLVTEEDSNWDFDLSAKSGYRDDSNVVNLDAIIERNRIKDVSSEDAEREQNSTAKEDPEEEDITLHSDDEDLAVDGFGTGAKTLEASDQEEEENNDDDDDDITEPVPSFTPLQNGVEGLNEESSASSDEEDEEEVAKKNAYFSEGDKDSADIKMQSSFQSMNLSRPILKGLSKMGFEQPTQIQSKTIPVALLGKDIVGAAITGSGKTAAFIVPILERLLYRPKKIPTSRVLVLVPTRELGIQCHSVATKIAAFTDIVSCLCVGGLSLKQQEQELRKRPDIIIATPGRFIDHMRNSQGFTVEHIEIMVMDEADRMLDDGFADELNEIINSCPKSRQTMLFSATMTDKVDDLIRLSLNRPVRLFVDAKKSTAKLLTQEFIRVRPQREVLRPAMLIYLCKTLFHKRTIIFFRSKAFAHKMRIIFGLLSLSATEIHGSLSQEQRIRALEDFRDGKCNYLLATDVASRGIDIKGIEVVINYEAPSSHEIYLHRVGRTARAGLSGRAVTLAGEGDRKVIKDVFKTSAAQNTKVVSRNLEFDKVESYGKQIKDLEDVVNKVLNEEKQEREIKIAERDLKKGENIIKHSDEIRSRPARTWFQSEKEKKASKAQTSENPDKTSLAKRKKQLEKEEMPRSYKKTKKDRMTKTRAAGKK
ncbi:ATP-dependent RNA helicase Ddx27/Drs1 [Schizosaccharomyces cryophilus OY26]|uniref:ATP-dependent RNA helicase DRS1 n=1 Tax=Schizosaccharomyces cryophilus (strain OY26 / ATCC MYA-4695 / CBS 11777 / NBRC 106824 / NRRL Y48691) TaxID=653667 RepID=S9VYF7_SCHCR|nr:ATP-dependent RNA helicase Ddx27/Drs1 [Schizosaccharomyces cryophilus OY26]EPY50825.1 ATP-dependent RNA helicase Ddx27/Drs1 [Schizosaccharomyces cryophilus OY26]